MAKEKRKTTRTCNKRLLESLFFLLFNVLTTLLVSQTVHSKVASSVLPYYRIEKQHADSVKLELFELLTLSFKINAKLKRAPQIILNSSSLKLQQSRVYHAGDATIIEVQYKLLKAGHIKVQPILVVDGIEMKQEVIEVFVLPPSLSQDAQFRVRLFDKRGGKILPVFAEEVEKQRENKVIKGEQYLLIVEGFFKSEDEDEFSVKSSNTASFVEDGFFIEKIEGEELNSFEKLSVFNSNDGWQILSWFYFYPLKRGKLGDIELNIHIKRKNGELHLFTLKDFPDITIVNKNMEGGEEKNEDVLFKREFRQQMSEHLNMRETKDDITFKHVEIAFKIKSLREKEGRALFDSKTEKMRLKLEEELGLTDSFAPFNYKWFILKLAISLIFIFSSFLSFTILYFKQQKIFKPFNVTLFVVGFLALSLTIWNADFSCEYTHVKNRIAYLHSFPSDGASVVEELKIGETVRVIRRHKEWMFVEKADYKRGWMK